MCTVAITRHAQSLAIPTHTAPQSQEREALDVMKRKARELQLAKKEARRTGGGMKGGFGGGFGGGSMGPQDYGRMPTAADNYEPPPPRSSYSTSSSSKYVSLCVCEFAFDWMLLDIFGLTVYSYQFHGINPVTVAWIIHSVA